MESHASAARTGLIGAARDGLATSVRRLYTDLDGAVTLGVAVILATIAFVGNGGRVVPRLPTPGPRRPYLLVVGYKSRTPGV